jgi:leader peptidase (prepilin peptidase)/N-methyltransferase
MGDVKLLGAMGLFLGAYVLLALLVGSFVGAAASIVTARRHPGVPLSRLKIPFGPYLALGGIVAALAGPAILGWYLGIIGL